MQFEKGVVLIEHLRAPTLWNHAHEELFRATRVGAWRKAKAVNDP